MRAMSPSPKLLYKTIPGVSALALGFLSAVWILDAQSAVPTSFDAPVAPPLLSARPQPLPEQKPIAALSAPVANPFGPFFTGLRGAARAKTASLSQDAPIDKPQTLEPSETVADFPLPPQRDPELKPEPQSLADAFQYEDETPLPPRRPSELGSSARLSAALTEPADGQTQKLTEAFQYEADAPLPPRRPSDLAPPSPPPVRVALPAPIAPQPQLQPQTRRVRQAARTAPAPQEDNRSFVEKLFGGPQTPTPAQRQPGGQTLAYAAPQASAVDTGRSIFSNSASGHDRYTAVYDISAHTVTLPNGTRLEAHSGLGSRLDDPRFVNERMRGATPPNVYELTPRGQLFHGVAALRLTPTAGHVYGRSGLLAHTYMLGPHGESNGCV